MNIDEILEDSIKNNTFTSTKSGLLLTNQEISVLKKYNIDYEKCSTLKEILFIIESIFEEEADDLDDLDAVSLSLAERDYYQNSNK